MKFARILLVCLLAALGALPAGEAVAQTFQGIARIVLRAPTTFYVSPAGGGNCLSPTQRCKLQAAWNLLVNSYDAGGQNVTIQGTNGDAYTPTNTGGSNGNCLTITTPWVGGGNVTIDLGGSSSTCAATGASGAISIGAPTPGTLILKNFTCSNSGGPCIYMPVSGAVVQWNNSFGTTPSAHVYVLAPGSIAYCGGNYSMTGTTGYHFYVSRGGSINCTGASITYTSSPTVSAFFAHAEDGGIINVPTFGHLNTYAGNSYDVRSNGIIDTGGGHYCSGTDNFFGASGSPVGQCDGHGGYYN